ncbi:Aste57867_1311 [Aphanomyces stellatus]|uniref:Aste57867_1311 protein n=1 Tax=Aphanomyces stellatus TaxID=120398 RepID=A0A485K5B2_9STRA|nr:hypothetical protein As57867_001310 [Aphanomyces stellatus]VFT78530.1 Aste57867_1311 [Aphanomyces stellatus]
MSWFNKPSSKPAPTANTNAISELQRLRGRQIASLVRAGGQAINHQQSIFDVVVRLVDARTLTLRITLPDEFPMQAPVIQTTSRVQHSWLDSQCRVAGHIDLASWSAHADIGRIVSDIVAEFQRSPPVPVGRGVSTPTVGASAASMYPTPAISTTPAAPSYQQPFHPHSQYPAYPGSAASSYGQQQPQPVVGSPYPPAPIAYNHGYGEQPKPREAASMTQSPAIPAVFPELEELSQAQLEKLVGDRATLKAYIKNMDSVVNFMKIYDDLVQGNHELAETNLGHEGSLQTLQSEVHALKQQVHTVQEALAAKQATQHELMAQFQPQAFVQRVSAAADEADNASEDIAARFTNGEIDVNQFVAEFLPTRKLYHVRTAKVERFVNQK